MPAAGGGGNAAPSSCSLDESSVVLSQSYAGGIRQSVPQPGVGRLPQRYTAITARDEMIREESVALGHTEVADCGADVLSLIHI